MNGYYPALLFYIHSSYQRNSARCPGKSSVIPKSNYPEINNFGRLQSVQRLSQVRRLDRFTPR